MRRVASAWKACHIKKSTLILLCPASHRVPRPLQCKAPAGRTYWSDSVDLDALGGAAVVTVPSPLLPPTAAIPAARAAYMMSGAEGVRRWCRGTASCVLLHPWLPAVLPVCLPVCLLLRLPPAPLPAVTASQVEGSEGALALYLLPRYLLVNTLDVPIQYKQQVGGEVGRGCGWGMLLLRAIYNFSATRERVLDRGNRGCKLLQLLKNTCLPVRPSDRSPAGNPAGAGAGGGGVARAALGRRAARAAPVRAGAGGGLDVERRL